VQSCLLQDAGEVLAILPTAREGAVGAGGEGEQGRVATLGGGGHSVREVGGPVPVAPVDREVDPPPRQLRLQSGLEG
ncbi:hypothetical protein ABE10_00485, partial [Bacillus toyonensis]|nr:hypothetical protein [Bacillus toyonensis]